jgi:hypothetical protein
MITIAALTQQSFEMPENRQPVRRGRIGSEGYAGTGG